MVDDEEIPDMTPDEISEVKKRIDDLEDPVRYIIASKLIGVLYYNISDDVWSTDKQDATRFKRERHVNKVCEMFDESRKKWLIIETVNEKKTTPDETVQE